MPFLPRKCYKKRVLPSRFSRLDFSLKTQTIKVELKIEMNEWHLTHYIGVSLITQKSFGSYSLREGVSTKPKILSQNYQYRAM